MQNSSVDCSLFKRPLDAEAMFIMLCVLDADLLRTLLDTSDGPCETMGWYIQRSILRGTSVESPAAPAALR